MPRVPKLQVEPTLQALWNWLEEHDELAGTGPDAGSGTPADDRDPKWDTVASIFVYIRDEISSGPRDLDRRAQKLVPLLRKAYGALEKVEKAGMEFRSVALECLAAEGTTPGFVRLTSTIFGRQEIADVDQASTLAHDTVKALRAAEAALKRPRPTPVLHLDSANVGVFLKIFLGLRWQKFTWPEIAALVFDDYGDEMPARAERYRVLDGRHGRHKRTQD